MTKLKEIIISIYNQSNGDIAFFFSRKNVKNVNYFEQVEKKIIRQNKGKKERNVSLKTRLPADNRERC